MKRGFHMIKKKIKIDISILVIILLFSFVSIMTIYSASTYLPDYLGNLAFKQIGWYLIGFLLVGIILYVKNESIYRLVWLFYITFNLLLALLLVFGTPINNSKCWFIVPGIGSFQPSEFMKIILILTLGKVIQQFKEKYPDPTLKNEFMFLIKALLIVLIPSVLTFLEPDTGVVLIYFIILISMLFLSDIRLRWFLLGGLIVLGILGLILGTYFLKQDLLIQLFGTKLFYRLDRLLDWKEGIGLQLENATAAIGSSGLLGHGFNKTPVYFPESGTDFIFAVFASNFGLIGAILLLTLILYFDLKLVFLAKKTKNSIDKYVLVGIVGMLVFQQIQNIGMTLGLLPIMGITLPFISYGGSSLLSYMIILGIILNISMEQNKST